MKTFSENENGVVENECSYRTGIFGGVLATLTAGLLLGLLGMGISLSLFSPAKGALYSLSIGTVVWLFFSTLVSMYIGGWVSGYCSPSKTGKNGILNGFIVSAVSVFICLALTFSGLGAIISGSMSGLRYALSATKDSAYTITSTVQGISKLSPKLSEKAKRVMPSLKPITDKINEKAAELLPEKDEVSAQKIKADLEKALSRYLNSIESANYEEAKEKLVYTLTEMTSKSSAEINEKIEEWKKDYIEAKEQSYQKVAEVSKEAARTVSQFALLNFFILLSGIIAGMVGGCCGTRKRRHL